MYNSIRFQAQNKYKYDFTQQEQQQQQQSFYSYYTAQHVGQPPAPPDKNWQILLEQSFTACMPC